MMIAGILFFSVSTFLCGLAPNFWSMIAFRFISGVSAAFLTPQVWASIPMLLPPQKILKGMGIATAGLAISQALGLPMGSYLASISWSTPFFVIGLASLLLSIPIWAFVPDILPAQNMQGAAKVSLIQRYRELLGTPKAVKAFLAYFIFQFGNFTAFSFLGTWLADDFSLSVSQVGSAMLVLGLGNIVGSFFGPNVVHKLGQRNALMSSLVALAGLYIILGNVTNLTVIEIFFFLLFVFTGTLFPLLMSLLQSLSSTARGTIAALSNSVMYAGTTLGGAIGGFLYANYGGFVSISFFTAIMFVVSMFVFLSSGVLSLAQAPQPKTQKVS